MTARTALRAAVLTATTALLVLPATPALAATVLATSGGSGSGLSVLQTLGIFVGLPLALFVGIWVIVAIPGIARGPRYRPGVGWWSAPVWFNGPDNPDQAARASSADTAAATASDGGGTSARW